MAKLKAVLSVDSVEFSKLISDFKNEVVELKEAIQKFNETGKDNGEVDKAIQKFTEFVNNL